jgi:CheY-like chemotaxis protein
MGGKIYLDDDYDSGIPGHPGTRFVIDLCNKSISPTELNILVEHHDLDSKEAGGPMIHDKSGHESASMPVELPENLSILFVDDDSVLRKLFSRALTRIRPSWSIRQAANGETALQLVESESFDIIFMDMYMASVEKQLLGTETVVALRNNGVASRICGLSANDIEEEFFAAGADSFMFKPFPCDELAMTNALRKILYEDDPRSSIRTASDRANADQEEEDL